MYINKGVLEGVKSVYSKCNVDVTKIHSSEKRWASLLHPPKRVNKSTVYIFKIRKLVGPFWL